MSWIRSAAQQSRHADSRQAKQERDELAALLARHEILLEDMLNELRKAFERMPGTEAARLSVRYQAGREIELEE
ncbi:MAG: hypothetical protein O3B22_10965 [Proteobacteria bacterium]|nr:hypothetical protein [Pseudomonadota bacterium]